MGTSWRGLVSPSGHHADLLPVWMWWPYTEENRECITATPPTEGVSLFTTTCLNILNTRKRTKASSLTSEYEATVCLPGLQLGYNLFTRRLVLRSGTAQKVFENGRHPVNGVWLSLIKAQPRSHVLCACVLDFRCCYGNKDMKSNNVRCAPLCQHPGCWESNRTGAPGARHNQYSSYLQELLRLRCSSAETARTDGEEKGAFYLEVQFVWDKHAFDFWCRSLCTDSAESSHGGSKYT